MARDNGRAARNWPSVGDIEARFAGFRGALAYGDKPSQAGAPTGPLVFEIELLAIRERGRLSPC